MADRANTSATDDQKGAEGPGSDADPQGGDDLGLLAKALVVPLAPIVLGWDALRAFALRAVPSLGRAAVEVLERPREPSLLAIFAHPDDESFAVGGTMARYATEGVEVSLLCATLGEAGIKGISPEKAARVREQELRAAVPFFIG